MNKNSQIQPNSGYDILGIGNPLLDIVINVTDEQLQALNLAKGSMTLISREESQAILAVLNGMGKEYSPGGSSANTMSGVNALGNKAAILGVIGSDEHGRLYSGYTENEGMISRLVQHESQATGHALILITPDGERTMGAHLGAAVTLETQHLSEEEISQAKILHIEAYQLEDPVIYQVLLKAFAVAKNNNTKISLDLSDASLIARNRSLFEKVIKEHIDIVFANEAEALEYTGKEPKEALHELAEHCTIAVVKLGAKGSLIKCEGQVHAIAPYKVEMINTNGAGDMYAAGILHGLINGLDMQTAGEIASHVSALVVASPGARLDRKHLDKIADYKNNK